MLDPNIKTRIVHSKNNPSWNIVGDTLGCKYKIARIPYVPSLDADAMDATRSEAKEHAEFINYCFNNSSAIVGLNQGNK